MGKQPPVNGVDNAETRNEVKTLVRDRWISCKMRGESMVGLAARQRLRGQWGQVATNRKRVALPADASAANKKMPQCLTISIWVINIVLACRSKV